MKRGSGYHQGNVQDQQLSVIPRSASYRLGFIRRLLQPLASAAAAAANLLLRRLQQQPQVRILQYISLNNSLKYKPSFL